MRYPSPPHTSLLKPPAQALTPTQHITLHEGCDVPQDPREEEANLPVHPILPGFSFSSYDITL